MGVTGIGDLCSYSGTGPLTSAGPQKWICCYHPQEYMVLFFSKESTEIKVLKNSHELNSFRFLKTKMLKVASHWWNVLKPNVQIYCHLVNYNIPGLCSSYTVLVLTLDVCLQQVCAYQVTCLNQQCWFTNNTFVTLLTQAGNMICTSCCLVTTCPSLGMS